MNYVSPVDHNHIPTYVGMQDYYEQQGFLLAEEDIPKGLRTDFKWSRVPLDCSTHYAPGSAVQKGQSLIGIVMEQIGCFYPNKYPAGNIVRVIWFDDYEEWIWNLQIKNVTDFQNNENFLMQWATLQSKYTPLDESKILK